MTEVNVALIGYAFMGRAHSNAYRQVAPFFAPRVRPRMKVLCGRTRRAVEEAARRLGWEEASTDWRAVVARKDVNVVDIATPGDSHAEIACGGPRRQSRLLRKTARQQCPGGGADAGRRQEGRRGAHGLSQLPPRPGGDARQTTDQRRGTRRDPPLPGHLSAGLAGRSRASDDLAQREVRAGSGALGDMGSHSVDLARFLVGEISEVAGHMATFVNRRPLPQTPPENWAGNRRRCHDRARAVSKRCDGDDRGSRVAPGRKNHNRFEINGSRGSVAFDLERMNELEVYLESDPAGGAGLPPHARHGTESSVLERLVAAGAHPRL